MPVWLSQYKPCTSQTSR